MTGGRARQPGLSGLGWTARAPVAGVRWPGSATGLGDSGSATGLDSRGSATGLGDGAGRPGPPVTGARWPWTGTERGPGGLPPGPSGGQKREARETSHLVYSEPSPVPGYGVDSSAWADEPAATAMPVLMAVAGTTLPPAAPVNFIVTL